MSDYLLNLSQIYNQSNSFSDYDNNNNDNNNDNNNNNNNNNNNMRYLKFNNFRIDNMMKKNGCELFVKDNKNYIDNKKMELSYYDKVMNNIFSKKEREIYRNIQNIIKTQERNDINLEVNEYLYSYLFILAIKKMFYDIIAQKKMECHINIMHNQNINKTNFQKKDIYKTTNNNLYKLKYNSNEKNVHQNEHAYYSKDIKIGTHELTHNMDNIKKNIHHEQSVNNLHNDDHCDDNKCDDNKCDDNKCDYNQCNTNQCNTNQCNTNQCNTNQRNTNLRNTNQHNDVPKDEITNNVSHKDDTNKIHSNKSKNFYKDYIMVLYNTMKKNKYYWLVPLSVISCIYIYYKMRVRVCFFFKNTYSNVCRFMTNIFFNNNGLHGNKNLILKDYNHFFNNINRNNVKTILFNPSSNTFTYMLDKNVPKTSGLMIYNNRLNNNENGSVGSSWLSSPSPSSSSSTHNNNILYMIYYNDYIMKYLLKNKVYEHVDFRVDDKLLKLSIYDIIRRNIFDILTYTFSILTFYYIYEKNILNCNNVDYSFEKQKKLQSLNDIILNDNIKREIKSMLFFVLYSKMFNEPFSCDTILFSGDTGTGKTMLAKTMAKELNFDFLHVSGSTFIELYIGSGASKIRTLFKKAKKNNKPMVIFIDEIDSIGISRCMNNDMSFSNQEYAQTLNQLLIELDSLHEYNKIHMLSEQNKQWNIFMYIKNKLINNIYGKENKTHNNNNNNIHDGNGDQLLYGKDHKISRKYSSYYNNTSDDYPTNNHKDHIDEKKAYDIYNYYLNNDLSIYEIEELFNLKNYRTQHFILFIGATNRYKQLDSALIRAKRFDKVIHFNLPNINTRMKLFSFYINKYIKRNITCNQISKKKNDLPVSPNGYASYMNPDFNYYESHQENEFTYVKQTGSTKNEINKYDDDDNNNDDHNNDDHNNYDHNNDDHDKHHQPCDGNRLHNHINNHKNKNNNLKNKNTLMYPIQPYNKYNEQYYKHFNYFNFSYDLKYRPTLSPFIINKNKKVHEQNTNIYNFIDIFTLSILTFHFNCADIDQLTYSVKSNLMTKNIINKKEFNVNNLLMINLDDMLHKKFTYDSHLDKIVSQKNSDEQEHFSSSLNNRILNACNVDAEEYFHKFLTYCNNIFLDKIKHIRKKQMNRNKKDETVGDKNIKKCTKNEDNNNNNNDDNNNDDDNIYNNDDNIYNNDDDNYHDNFHDDNYYDDNYYDDNYHDDK
ncbi:hypothetical protein PFMALIP_01983 [Plasmodium falciparum MaliPS096_E11]|uniref:AAA+ ATPase domain-containing protein n=1 Tax=Plasmodium falciparum MaliPS096_E11 TaxID=1036727 RepID=A0A024WRX6_PLAFA|nr:hypothetical protein PFMALIP_01983 [Plasmodium falciparum MaliPS096_E11]